MEDKDIVYEMCTKSAQYVIATAHETGIVFDFGEKAEILNKLNYGTVINRLRKALNQLYLEGKCERSKYGKGYYYDFTNSLF